MKAIQQGTQGASLLAHAVALYCSRLRLVWSTRNPGHTVWIFSR